MLRKNAAVATLLLLALNSFASGGPEPSPARPVTSPDGAWAVFAGGCFWCMEEAFEQVPGVADVVSGFAGGSEADPQYLDVARGLTGHREVIRVEYDPAVVTYAELLYVFWRNIDPLDAGGQFCDRGSGYASAVYYRTEEEGRVAEETRLELERSGRFSRPIVTEIGPLPVLEGNDGFWPAEEYHQDYYRKNPVQYRAYKTNCGRTRRLQQLWGEEAGATAAAAR